MPQKIGGVSFFALLVLLSPLIVVALSAIVLKERISRNTWIALAVYWCSSIVIVSKRTAQASHETDGLEASVG